MENFYGVEITFNNDGSESRQYCGGYKPRDLTDAELEPWLELAREIAEAGQIPACIAA